MPLETIVWVGDMNPANPPGTDPKNQGDDHLRGIKRGLLDSFAGFTGAILVTGVDGGSANAYTLTPANIPPAYTARMLVEFVPTVDNTGASTMNIGGLGVIPILSIDGAVLAPSDLRAGVPYIAIMDASQQLRLIATTKRYIDNLAISANFPPPPNDGRQYVIVGLNGSGSYKQYPVGASTQAYKLGAL